jgi:hypothetical protein
VIGPAPEERIMAKAEYKHPARFEFGNGPAYFHQLNGFELDSIMCLPEFRSPQQSVQMKQGIPAPPDFQQKDSHPDTKSFLWGYPVHLKTYIHLFFGISALLVSEGRSNDLFLLTSWSTVEHEMQHHIDYSDPVAGDRPDVRAS